MRGVRHKMKLYGNDDKKFILILNGDKNKPSGLDGMSYEKYTIWV